MRESLGRRQLSPYPCDTNGSTIRATEALKKEISRQINAENAAQTDKQLTSLRMRLSLNVVLIRVIRVKSADKCLLFRASTADGAIEPMQEAAAIEWILTC